MIGEYLFLYILKYKISNLLCKKRKIINNIHDLSEVIRNILRNEIKIEDHNIYRYVRFPYGTAYNLTSNTIITKEKYNPELLIKNDVAIHITAKSCFFAKYALCISLQKLGEYNVKINFKIHKKHKCPIFKYVEYNKGSETSIVELVEEFMTRKVEKI